MSHLSPPSEQWVSGPRPTASGNVSACSSTSSMRNEREKNQQRQRAQDTADRKQLAQLMLEVARVKAGKHTPSSSSQSLSLPNDSNSSDTPLEAAVAPPILTSTANKRKRTKQERAEEIALFDRLRDERLARKRLREEEERKSQLEQEIHSQEAQYERKTSKKKKKKKEERKRRREAREEKRERKRIKREEEEKAKRRLQDHESQPVSDLDEVAEVINNNDSSNSSDSDSDCSSSSSVVVLQEPPRSSTLAPLKSPSTLPHSTIAFVDLTGAPRSKYVSSDDVCSVDLDLDSSDRKAMKKQLKAQAKRHKTHLASVLLQTERNEFVPLMEYCEEHALEFGFQTAMYKHYSGASGFSYRTRMRALETAAWSLPASLHLAAGDNLYRLEMRLLRVKLNNLASEDTRGRLSDVDEDVAEIMRRLINEMLMAMLRASFAWKSIVHLHADAEQPLQQEPVFKDLNVEQFETIKNNYFQDKKRKKISAPTQAELNAQSIPTATIIPRVSSTGTSFDVTVHHSTSNQTTKTPVRPRITAPTSPLPTTPPPPTTPVSTCCKYCGCTKVSGGSSSDGSSGGSPSPARTSSHTSSSSTSSLSSTPSTTTVVLNFAQPPNAMSQQQHQPPISLWNPYPHWQHPQLPMPALSLAASQPSTNSTTTKSRKARSLSSLLNAPSPGGYMPFGSLMMQPSPSPFYYSPTPLQFMNAQAHSRFPYGTSFVPTTPMAASIPATAVASAPVTPKTPKIRAPSIMDTDSPLAAASSSPRFPLSPSNEPTTTSFEMPPAVLRVKSKASTKSIRISAPVQKQSHHSKTSKHQHKK